MPGDVELKGLWKCPEDKGTCVARVKRASDGCFEWGVGMDCRTDKCNAKIALN